MVHNETIGAESDFARGAKVDLLKTVQRAESFAALLALLGRFFLLHSVADPLVLLDALIAGWALLLGQFGVLAGGADDRVAALGAQPDRLLYFFEADCALRI